MEKTERLIEILTKKTEWDLIRIHASIYVAIFLGIGFFAYIMINLFSYRSESRAQKERNKEDERIRLMEKAAQEEYWVERNKLIDKSLKLSTTERADDEQKAG